MNISPPTIEYDPEIYPVSCDTQKAKPNLKGDWLNFYLLLLLYTMQGLPYGIITALPIILQSRKVVSYEDQALFSFVLWPYSMKLLWAPLVDALYVRCIGRRKSWLIPVQYLMGILMIGMANTIDIWLPETGKPNLKLIICLFFFINYLAATQDIVVDGWALTMLRKNNVNYASTCNGTGLALGTFVGSVCPILFTPEDFCNTYLRNTPSTGGIMTFNGFLYFWGVTYIIITTLLAIFKKEKNVRLEDGYVKINVLQNYKLLWDILKLPHIKVLTLALLTARVGYAAMDAVSNLKLIDAGVSKDDITMIAIVVNVMKIFFPLIITKYTSSSKPMNLYLVLTPIRILWNLAYAALIYYTPTLMTNNGDSSRPVSYYNFIFGFIWIINEALYFIMLVAVYAFSSQISDPHFGGTYMTLLNTVNTLGYVGSNTLVLKLVDVLTFYKCSNDAQNTCSTSDLKHMCVVNGGSCEISVDGYYVEIVLCMIAGCIWYSVFNKTIRYLQSMSLSNWLVNVKQSNTEKLNNSIVMTST